MSDYQPTSVRLEPDLKELLIREAEINRRSLSSEITLRLKHSLEGQQPLPLMARSETGTYQLKAPPPLSDTQRMLLTLFSALSPEKQLALLTVLKR